MVHREASLPLIRARSQAWPNGAIMNAIQQAQVFPDSKHFVDMPLRSCLTSAITEFGQLSVEYPSLDSLLRYVADHHEDPGSDLVPCRPPDFEDIPNGFLPELRNQELREWALKVHSLWTILCRKVVDRVKEQPHFHTLLPLPNVVFIPGDRFRETYYWDSYWIIRGLLVSGMPQSATSLVMNLCEMLGTYGFIPNGARSYYLNRSQPPLLSAMVRDVYKATKSQELLRTVLPLLLTEHQYWISGAKVVQLVGRDGKLHTLTRYHAEWYQPRPESYREDVELTHGLDAPAAAQMYCDIATGAESGWDFSSRWFADSASMSTIRTTRIVPADLNAFLCQLENNIADFAAQLGDQPTSSTFRAVAEQRRVSINACLWSSEAGCWFDVVLNRKDEQSGIWFDWQWNAQPFASNWLPLWCGVCDGGSEQALAAVRSFKGSGLLQPAGVATSLNPTGQQWDAPNAWPPLQHMLVEGLRSTGWQEGVELATQLALTWVKSCYIAFRKTGQMHEKYNSLTLGGIGGGGEYVPQTGFGWSNGVVLDLLAQYSRECDQAPGFWDC